MAVTSSAGVRTGVLIDAAGWRLTGDSETAGDAMGGTFARAVVSAF
jgi:hypothetical protein